MRKVNKIICYVLISDSTFNLFLSFNLRTDDSLLLIVVYQAMKTIPVYTIFLLTGLRIYTGEYKAQGPTLCPTERRALRGPRALDSPV